MGFWAIVAAVGGGLFSVGAGLIQFIGTVSPEEFGDKASKWVGLLTFLLGFLGPVDDALLWVGVSLLSFAAGLLVGPWIQRRGTGKKPQVQPTAADSGPPSSRPIYDCSFKQAFEYLRDVAEIGDEVKVMEELRQAARNGEITIWGRPQSGHLSQDQLIKPLEPIPEEHWRDFGLDYLKCIFDPDDRKCRTEPDNSGGLDFDKVYVDLRLSDHQIKTKWSQQTQRLIAKATDPEIDQILRDVGRVRDLLLSYDPYESVEADVLERYERLKGSDHTVLDCTLAVRQGNQGQVAIAAVWSRCAAAPDGGKFASNSDGGR